MSKFATLEQINVAASGRWLEIFAALASDLDAACKSIGSHVDCPLHGGKSDFRICNKKGPEVGLSYCTCGTRNGYQLLQECNGWSFLEAKDAVSEFVGLSSTSEDEHRAAILERSRMAAAKRQAEQKKIDQKRDASIANYLNGLWQGSVPLDDPKAAPARRYFHMRKIPPTAVSSHIRFCESVKLKTEGYADTYMPAIVSRVYNNIGQPLTIHLTYITHKGEKIKGIKSKRLMPVQAKFEPGNGLFVPVMALCGSKIMGIAEGIETALSAGLLHNLPVWSAISSGPLRNFMPPESIEHLICYADLDANGTGTNAAIALAQNLTNKGWKGQLHVYAPPAYLLSGGAKSVDWADVWYHQATNPKAYVS